MTSWYLMCFFWICLCLTGFINLFATAGAPVSTTVNGATSWTTTWDRYAAGYCNDNFEGGMMVRYYIPFIYPVFPRFWGGRNPVQDAYCHQCINCRRFLYHYILRWNSHMLMTPASWNTMGIAHACIRSWLLVEFSFSLAFGVFLSMDKHLRNALQHFGMASVWNDHGKGSQLILEIEPLNNIFSPSLKPEYIGIDKLRGGLFSHREQATTRNKHHSEDKSFCM